LNIIQWAATAKQVEVGEDHEAQGCGFTTVIEHEDGSWIGVVDEPADHDGKYFVMVSNYNEFFERLSDAQVALWEHWARGN
jgi:hypothetical protein